MSQWVSLGWVTCCAQVGSGLRQRSSLFLSGLESRTAESQHPNRCVCAGCCGVRVCGARVCARVRERRYGTARRPAASIPRGGVPLPYRIRGVPRWCDRFCQYGIKVCFWGSGTLTIVIYVETYPQKRSFRLDDYHAPLGGRCY